MVEEGDTAAGYMDGAAAAAGAGDDDEGGNIADVVADAAGDGEYCMAVEATVDAAAFDVATEAGVVGQSRHTIDQRW